jgi:NAD(P)-dependent dehydrogenase (short-subunit alcohol dehydrogenase family)
MTLHSGRFSDRVALVTGAAGGIGAAIAARFAAEGARVAVADVRDPAPVAGEIGALPITVDLADPVRRKEIVPAVLDAYGRVDVLVNNAATLGVQRDALRLAEEDWDTVLAVNLTAAAVLARDAARDMATRGAGVIVNLTSLHEHLPIPGHVAYAASKGGVTALTRALAVDLAPHGIRVNAVVPGMIGSDSLHESLAGAGASSVTAPPTLLGRLGTPDEVASTVSYLASAEAEYVTGAIWRVDGGRGVSRRPDPLTTEPEE